MAKEEFLQFEGIVIEARPRFRVQRDAGHEIVAYTAGGRRTGCITIWRKDR
jgi:translation initiation factor IF-1